MDFWRDSGVNIDAVPPGTPRRLDKWYRVLKIENYSRQLDADGNLIKTTIVDTTDDESALTENFWWNENLDSLENIIKDNVLCCGVTGGWCTAFGKITGSVKVYGVRTAFIGDSVLNGTAVVVDNCREMAENGYIQLGNGVTVTRSGGIRTSGTLELKEGASFQGTFTGGSDIRLNVIS